MEKERSEVHAIRWCGFDWGETLMDPRSGSRMMRKMLREIFVELKRPEVADEQIAVTFELAKKYGQARDVSDLGFNWFVEGTEGRERRFWESRYPFKQLVHKGMKEFYLVVLDNDPNAIELFRNKQIRLLKPARNVKQCLRHLEEKGISINIVSDSPNESVTRMMFECLELWGLEHFFSDTITPIGRFKGNELIDSSYKGLEKVDGRMYEKLVEDLRNAGISPSESMIVGDRAVDDIKRAKEKGLKTVQFTGIVNRGPSGADHVISDLAQLKDIV